MKYILSKYTKTIENKDNNHTIIYNTYNGKQSYIFDDQIKEQVSLLKNSAIDELELDDRLISDYCVTQDLDESLVTYNKIQEMMQSDESLSLILFPTLDCNFNCTYCYENKESGFMTSKTVDNIYNAVVNHYNTNKFKYLKLEWFGGEPLLFINQLLEFTNRINDFCLNNNIIYQHSITTNGYLLNDKNIKSLLNSKIEIFQITIDGMAKTHDRYRCSKSGKPTWEIIINNLITMKSFKNNFRILIRINYNYEILDSLDEFLEFYKNNFGDDSRFELGFKAIGHWGGEQDNSVTTIPLDYQPYVLDELLNKCSELHILSLRHFNFSCGSELCYANKKNSFVIYKNGNIGKCTLEELPEETSNFVIGNINDGFFNIDENKEKLWCPNDKEFIEYLKQNGCFDCIAYPFCCGTSCPAHRIKSGFNAPNKCTPTKPSLDNIVKLNYEMNK